MIPAAFDYHAPGSLAEAIELLGRYGDAKVLSGGQSLLPLLKLRMGSAGHLIDINRVPGLEYIKEEGGFLKIGGRTRESALEESELIHKKYPILADTAAVIADPIVRNLATIGGNLAHGDPANDHPATMLALGAVVVATGKKGERTIPIDSVLHGPLRDGPRQGRDPDGDPHSGAAGAESGGAYVKLERKVGDFATAGAAAQVALGAGGEIARAGIALTNAGLTPVKATDAEKFLVGKKPDAATIAEAAKLAAEATDPQPTAAGRSSTRRRWRAC